MIIAYFEIVSKHWNTLQINYYTMQNVNIQSILTCCVNLLVLLFNLEHSYLICLRY